MSQMAIILAAIIISFALGCLQCVSDAQSLLDRNTQLEPIAVPLAPPEDVQQIDFLGDVNAILEDKMLWSPQAAPNESIEEQGQPELPIRADATILKEEQVASLPPADRNATAEFKNLMQLSEKKTNSDAYSIGICNSTNLSGFLIDGNGTALYYFKGDLRGNGIGSCTGACLELWRPFYMPVITVMPGLNLSDFTIFTSASGIKQIAYKGWPLYHNINDIMPGDAKGQGIDGAWFVIDPGNFPPK